MSPHPFRLAPGLAAIAFASALAGCAALDTQKNVAQQAEVVKVGPKAAPFRSITGFSAGLRCMDNLLLDYGVRDVAVIAEDLADQTKKVNAGTKDMMISAVSDMTRRSRAIRLVAYGQDSGNTLGFLSQALKRDHFATVPQYALRGSISQFDDAIVRRNLDAGVGISPGLNVGVATTSQASVLGLDLTMLSTQDLSVMPGVASRNSVILFKQGKGYDGEAEIRKFGINFSLSTSTQEGQAQALRSLIELASIEVFGRLAKVPYWTCLGANDSDETVNTEIHDWYDSMAANPAEIIEYFQVQMRVRRVYDGPIDGIVNAQIKEAVARYREGLGLSREPKLSFELFKAYLSANHREVSARVEPVPAAPVAEAAPPASAAASSVAGSAAPAKIKLQIGTLNNARKFAPGDVVQLALKLDRNAHVYCFLQDENLKISRFFPNRFRRDSRVDAAQGLALPGAMRFEIRMNPRGTQETVSCFATERDVLPDLPAALVATDFEPLPVASLEQVRDAFINATGGLLAQEYFHVQPK